MSTLWASFLSHDGRPIHKWTHYFPAYERHFSRYVDRPVVFLEIGVARGGSLQLWKRYLGPLAQIVGLDIIDKTAFEEDQIAIRVGDQADHSALERVLDEFGPPDIILDDGSHVMADIEASFRYLYPRMAPQGVYMIEDLHTAYWPEYGGGLRSASSFVEIAKGLVDELNADTSAGSAVYFRDATAPPIDSVTPTEFTASTLSMHFYDSVIAFERGRHVTKRPIFKGTETEGTPIGAPAEATAPRARDGGGS
jgi:hypothetical protein